jgi:hypothetical protein
MLCLVLKQFFITLAPDSFMGVPTKANVLKSLCTFCRHMRAFACLHERKVATLLLDPQTEFGVFWMTERNEAVAIIVLVVPEGLHVTVPCGTLCVPRKVEAVEALDSLGINAAGFSILEKFVLFPLLGDPRCETRVGIVSARNDAVAVFLLVGNELIERVHPLRVLLWRLGGLFDFGGLAALCRLNLFSDGLFGSLRWWNVSSSRDG